MKTLNKKQKLLFLKALENNPRVTGLTYNADLLHRGWDDSIWFGGSVLGFTLDERYVYDCVAVGDIRITHIPTNDDVVSKGNDFYRVREFLLEHDLITDKKINKAEEKGELYFGNNNWFEDHIYDTKNKEWLDEGLDISDGPFWDTPEQLLEYLDEIIE